MNKFETHTGIPVPLRRSNVDTDQIIPAHWLKKVTRTGYEEGLFESWRRDPAFVLNEPVYRGGTILIAGPDFGIGSSREHAVWALQNYGFRVVLGSKFADIFRGNAGKGGLLVAQLCTEDVEALWQYAEDHPGQPITVDLVATTVSTGDGSYQFEIDEFTRGRLLAGLDDIGETLTHEDEIATFEAARPAWALKTLPQKV